MQIKTEVLRLKIALRETLKILPQKPDPIVIDKITECLGSIGAIHHTPSQLNTLQLAKVLLIIYFLILLKC